MKHVLYSFALVGLTYLLISSFDESSISPYHPGVDRSGGPAAVLGQDRTGGPLSVGTCSACHSGGTYDPSFEIEVLDGDGIMAASYIPGETYTINYTVSSTVGTANGYGMQSVALNDANGQAGIFGTPTTANTQLTPLTGRTYVEHDGISTGGASYIFSVPWIAPATGTGNVTIYGIGLAANATGGTAGDDVSTSTSLVLSEEIVTSISYGIGIFCDNNDPITPSVTGDDEGLFSSTAGLAINAGSGVITPSESDPGEYVVTYTFGEPAEETTVTIAILESYATETSAEICPGDVLLFDGTELTEENEGLNEFTLTATNGCDSIVTLDLIVLPAPTVEAHVNDTNICLGDSVIFSASGTEAIYSWDEGVTGEVPFYPEGTGEDTYTVTATDDSGCTSTDSVSVTVNQLELTATITDEGIDGGLGEIDLTVSGGIPPYSFDWDNDETGDFDDPEDLTNLTEGSYTVIVIDSDECEATDSYIINSVASILELDGKQISIYPNPAKNDLVIEFEDAYTYQITTINGEVLIQGKGTNKSILSLSDLPTGIYFVNLTSEGITKSIKIMKE